MVGGDDPFYLKFGVNRPALERNRRCLDASHDRGFKRINNGIARHLLHAAYKPAAACGRYHVGSSVATGLLKISQDLRSKKIKTQIKKKVQTSKYLRN